MEDMEIKEFKEKSEAFLKGQDSQKNIKDEERVLKVKRRNLKSNQLIKMFNSMIRKLSSSTLDSENNLI
eukprot:CAMPEP_0170543164 /NCGR_PEP_ID=MMETSP0211-20121228/2368_1 /TAXON_ID=311385 /ORGANISM="Pseudokeronopsis sp., Strain OXSARD2" /LENGTH=68 /DNA_ID=CAMNT_0010846475 /DNA_START=216 /DNA_END=422 /DNA_ORIENTATION=+